MPTSYLGKALSLFALVAFLVLGTGVEVSAQQESSCHQEQANNHAEDCRDLPTGHDHSSHPCEGACQMSHCQLAHGGLVAQRYGFSSYPSALSLGHQGRSGAVYLNPYLGKIIQPPRA